MPQLYYFIMVKNLSLGIVVRLIKYLCLSIECACVFSLISRAADAVITGRAENIITYHMNNISNGKGGKPQLPLVINSLHFKQFIFKCKS